MTVLYTIVHWTWCLAQSLIGLFLYIYVKLTDPEAFECRYQTGAWLVRTRKLKGSISLGYFIFAYDYSNQTQQRKTERHEWGHTLQGFLLGPLYLIIIGLPSLIWAGLFRKYREENNISYYSFYTESWADALGGVKRDG
jgi:hypothetical protein